jgi:capsular exopolysaccharide synthesis family protein
MMSSTPALRDAYTDLLGGLRLNAQFDLGNALLVTSTQPSEGKTTVACCLAIAASLSGQAVLLVDGDLRRPWLTPAAGISDAAGLSDVLAGGATAAEAIHLVELFEYPQEAGPLSIMAGGRKSPAFFSAIDWTKARTAFRSFSEQFGVVLMDSPPILAANDALLLASIVDGVILVVDAGTADRYEVRRAKQQLEPIGTPVIGAVLTRFNPRIHGRPHQPYRSYYLETRR